MRLLKLAEHIYRATPSLRLRALYFKAFCHVVRGHIVQAEIDGTRFELDLGETIDLTLYLKQFERDVVQAIEAICKPGMTAIDVGANIGAHALRLARLVGETGHLYAFEPTGYAFRKLSRNLSLNNFPHARAIQMALSSERARNREIRLRSSWRTNGQDTTTTDSVDFIPLDDWCQNEGVDNLDLIKLDVDGNEFPVISGGMNTIRRHRPILVMEAVGPHFDDDARNPYVALAELGYRFQDTKTGVHYAGPREIGALLPRGDYGMTRSLNVIARPAPEKE
jgi:FkbM family methyltransferase